MKTTLNINGGLQVVDVVEGTPLLWVLRDHLELTGTKFGCGKGLCGACTVHLEGVPVRSCQIKIETVRDAEISTIENLKQSAPKLLEVWRSSSGRNCMEKIKFVSICCGENISTNTPCEILFKLF